MTLGGSKQCVVDYCQQSFKITCSKVDQYYYGAKPDVQRAGVQVCWENKLKMEQIVPTLNKISTKAIAVHN